MQMFPNRWGRWKLSPNTRKPPWEATLICVCLGLVLGPVTGIAQTLHPLLTNGPVDQRLNLVVLSEGYTAGQLGQFLTDATALVETLLAAEPYASYRAGFNAFAISIASEQSGADHPSQGTYRNTYFNSSYDSYGVGEYLTIPPNDRDPDVQHGTGRVMALLDLLMPQCDLPILLVNDPLYGNSGGSVLVCSRSPANGDTVVHESGHTLAGLGDEYEEPVPGFPDVEEPNTTRETRRDLVKWKAWIEPTTPVPTPATTDYVQVTGLFEGAHYHTTGWYRPKLNCKMRDPADPFCEVCQEALVNRFYQKFRPVDGFLPGNTNLTFTAPGTHTFNVAPLLPTAALEIRWSLDQSILAGQTRTNLQLQLTELSNGQHRLRVEVRDTTSRVKSDPDGRLRQTVEWQLQITLPWLRLNWLEVLPGTDRLSVTGAVLSGVIIEGSTNLLHWRGVSTNSLKDGYLELGLPVNRNTQPRFYRARSSP